MENKDPKLNLLLACLDDVVASLQEWSAYHQDFCLDEIVLLKETSGAIRDQAWKLGEQQ